MRYAFLAVLFLLVSATACATEKGKVPEDTLSVNPEVSVMFNRGTDSWTAVEFVKGRGCIIQSGKFWAGTIDLPGNSL